MLKLFPRPLQSRRIFTTLEKFLNKACAFKSKKVPPLTWSDLWIPSLDSFKPTPRDPNSEIDPNLKVGDFIRWNTTSLSRNFSADSVERILRIHLLQVIAVDKLI